MRIPPGPLPGRQAVGGHVGQRLGAGMLGGPRHGLLTGWQHQVRTVCRGRRGPRAGIVGAIGIDLGERVLDRLQPPGKDVPVRPLCGGDFDRQHVFDLGIHRHLDLASGAPLAGPMLADCPVALTGDR